MWPTSTTPSCAPYQNQTALATEKKHHIAHMRIECPSDGDHRRRHRPHSTFQKIKEQAAPTNGSTTAPVLAPARSIIVLVKWTCTRHNYLGTKSAAKCRCQRFITCTFHIHPCSHSLNLPKPAVEYGPCVCVRHRHRRPHEFTYGGNHHGRTPAYANTLEDTRTTVWL